MKKIYIVLLLIFLPHICFGCLFDGYDTRNEYPHYKSESWYCKEIDFRINYQYQEDGRMNVTSYPLIKEGETLYIYVTFTMDNWYFDLDNNDNHISSDEQLLSGTWSYQDGNLILNISKDSLFQGTYTNLIFVPDK